MPYTIASRYRYGINSSSRLKPEWPGWRVVPGRSVWETRERERDLRMGRQWRQHVNETTRCHWAHQSGQPSGKSKASAICFTFPLFSHLFLSVHRPSKRDLCLYLLQELSAILFCQHGRCGIFQVILLGRMFCLYFDLWDLGELLNALAKKDDCMCVFLGLEFSLFKDLLFKKHRPWDTDGKVPWCPPPPPSSERNLLTL